MTSAIFLIVLLSGGALSGLLAWKFLGILTKRQALFTATILLVAALAAASWEYTHFIVGAVLLLLGAIITTFYLENATQQA
ncbi:MAG: hypothetical protein D6755_00970 [Anaerolineae bacterium]|nr:MAG: hypothetical protein D6755_00970 [Anaerolineae bacterium]